MEDLFVEPKDKEGGWEDAVYVTSLDGRGRVSPGHLFGDFVLRTDEYDSNLGMRTRAAVRRQLAVDLPRSMVYLEGIRSTSADEVIRAAPYPRLCTQASLAPPIEWLLLGGVVAHERSYDGGRQPMTVRVQAGEIKVTKILASKQFVSEVRLPDVSIEILASRGCTVISISSLPCT